jgi:hypothetical protein
MFEHTIDANEPMLGRVRLLDVFEIKVFATDLNVAHAIKAGHLALMHFAESIEAELVHQRVEHDRIGIGRNAVLTRRANIVFLLNAWIDRVGDAHHPQKLVNIVRLNKKQKGIVKIVNKTKKSYYRITRHSTEPN